MLPSIDNEYDPQPVKNALDTRGEEYPPSLCIIKALKFCLVLPHFLQTDGTAQGSRMFCSYSDIAIEQFGKKALEYIIGWERFRDDIFLV